MHRAWGEWEKGKNAMNIAVLSDIHGNHVALKTCMEYLEKQDIDAYCFLGDYLGEFPGTRQVMDTLYALREKKTCYIIKGNKEEYQLFGLGEGHPEWDAYPSTVGMLRYGRQHLTQEDISFLSRLPITDRICINGMEDIRICHGSQRDVREDIRPGRSQNEEILAGVEEKYMLCGHTHRAMGIQECGKVVWNPGSVGLPIIKEGGMKAQFMILHGGDRDGNKGVNGEWSPEFMALDYDIEYAIQDMRENGLYEIAPYWSRVTECILRGKRTTLGRVLRRAMELCGQETGRCDWPKVPERCWKRAYEEMMGEF